MDIIADDTDSATSSASTIEELNEQFHLNEQFQLIDINNLEQTVRNKLKNKLIQPIKSYTYFDRDKGVDVEDSYELVLLRLLHLFFSIDGFINFNYLTINMNMDIKECQEIEEFFINYPGVMIDSDFYSSDAGIIIRKQWYEFLSNRDFFTYVHVNHMLFPSNNNFLIFIKHFFPLINFFNNPNDQAKLDVIYSHFNCENNFKVCYSTYSKIESKFIHNISVNDINLFIIESISVTELNDQTKLDFTQTKLRYSD